MFAMAFPMLAGTFAMNAYSLTDAWFVARLGTFPLAAIGFAFPVITRIMSGFGNEAVAAGGVAGRIEMFAFIIPMALGMSMTPFISQNYGACRLDRIREAVGLAYRFALLYGGGVAVLFFICARPLGALFSSDPRVVDVLVAYIRIISFGYGLMETHRYSGMILTGMHRPMSATLLNAIRVLVLLIPLSCLGAYLYGVRGVFVGRLTTDCVVGVIGMLWVRRLLKRAPLNLQARATHAADPCLSPPGQARTLGTLASPACDGDGNRLQAGGDERRGSPAPGERGTG